MNSDMKMCELTDLLDENGYSYKVYYIDDKEFYAAKGCCNIKQYESVLIKVVSIKNPNHSLNLDFTLYNRNNNFVVYDLWFGGYSFELFDFDDDDLADVILDNIKTVVGNKMHIIFARNAKTDKWFCDCAFYECDDDFEDDMDDYEDTMKRIRKKIGRTDKYEVYTWKDYECIIK